MDRIFGPVDSGNVGTLSKEKMREKVKPRALQAVFLGLAQPLLFVASPSLKTEAYACIFTPCDRPD